MSDTQVTFVGNADQLIAEHKKVDAAREKDIAKLREMLAESKKYHNEDNKLQREAQAALEKTRTAQQVYNDQLQKWFNLMAQGKLTAQQFNTLKADEKKKLDDATAAINKESDALKKSTADKQVNAAASRMSQSATVSLSGAFGTVAAIIGTATVAMRAFSAEQKRLQDEASGTVTSLDTLARTYAVQAGLKPEEINQNRDAILEVAKVNAVTPEFAFKAATQLSGSGFADPVESGTLDGFLKILASSNLKGGDPKEYVLAMSKFMGGYGKDMTKENMMDLGVRMRGLFKDTNVEVSDLTEFSKAAPAFKASNVSMDDSLALMTTLVQGMPSAAEASTGARNIVSILSASAATKSGVNALESMGLKPEDVDLIGETLPQALGKLKAAQDAMPETERIPALTKLFGRENTAAAMVAIEGLPEMPKWIASQKDTEGFTQGVNIAQSGDQARQTRESINLTQARLKNQDTASFRNFVGQQEERKYEEMWNNIETSNLSPADKKSAKMALQAGRFAKETINSLTGANPEEWRSQEGQMQLGLDYVNQGSSNFTADDLKKQLPANQGPAAAAPQAQAPDPLMAEQTAVLKEIRDKLATPPAITPRNPSAAGRPDQ